MTLTTANPDVIDIPSVSTSLAADPVAGGIKEYADNLIAGSADLNSPNFTGVPTAPTAAPGTNTTQLATTEFVTNIASSITAPVLKAWCIFDGTSGGTFAPLMETNIDHIVKSSRGVYTIYFITPMANTYYGVMPSINSKGFFAFTEQNTTSFKLTTYDNLGATADFTSVGCLVFGE